MKKSSQDLEKRVKNIKMARLWPAQESVLRSTRTSASLSPPPSFSCFVTGRTSPGREGCASRESEPTPQWEGTRGTEVPALASGQGAAHGARLSEPRQ